MHISHPPAAKQPGTHSIGNRGVPRADPHSLPDFMQQTDELVFERLRRIDNWQLTVDNYVPQPCLFENIVLIFDHNDYVLSRRDSLIVNC